MLRSSRAALVVSLAAVLLAALPVSLAFAVNTGDRAPEIGLNDLNGHRVSMASLRGHVVIVDTWASWCGPCAAEFPVLERLYSQFRGQGLVIVGVSADNDASNVRTFLSRHHASFPIVHDASHAVIPRYAPPTMPSSYVIDKRGIVRFVHRGFEANRDTAALQREVTQLLRAS